MGEAKAETRRWVRRRLKEVGLERSVDEVVVSISKKHDG